MTLVEIIQSAETYSGTLTITDGKPGPIFSQAHHMPEAKRRMVANCES